MIDGRGGDGGSWGWKRGGGWKGGAGRGVEAGKSRRATANPYNIQLASSSTSALDELSERKEKGEISLCALFVGWKGLMTANQTEGFTLCVVRELERFNDSEPNRRFHSVRCSWAEKV